MAQEPVPVPVPPGQPPRPYPVSSSPAGPPPSGLFPAGRRPPTHPTYREPHPVGPAAIAAGGGGATYWMLVFGLLGHTLTGYLWWTLLGGLVAWALALVLTRYGDRGVAAGVALLTSIGISIATIVAAYHWSTAGEFPLW
jgi:hypothetical protein